MRKGDRYRASSSTINGKAEDDRFAREKREREREIQRKIEIKIKHVAG